MICDFAAECDFDLAEVNRLNIPYFHMLRATGQVSFAPDVGAVLYTLT